MATDQFVQVSPDSTGKKIDNSELYVGLNTVERQRINISDPVDPNAHAAVVNTPPASPFGVVVWITAQQLAAITDKLDAQAAQLALLNARTGDSRSLFLDPQSAVQDLFSGNGPIF